MAEPETKVFGSADPTLAYTSSGFQFTDTAATVLTGSLARAAGETVAGSPYAISQGTLAADSNYTIHFTGSSLSITPATPGVTVSARGGTYTGAPITATATVTGVDGTAAASLEGVTPTLTYYAGSGTSGTDLGAAAPSAVGTYTVVASFPGSADYAPTQSAPATFVIAPVITRSTAAVALTSSASTAVFGQAVTFVATVSSSAGTTGGTVTFFDGTTPLATVTLNGSGQATLSVNSLALGSHAITATYNGAAGLPGPSSSATTESVRPAATAIVLVPHAVLKGKKTLKGDRADRGDRAGGPRRGRADGPGDVRVRHEAPEEDPGEDAGNGGRERRCGDGDVQAHRGAEQASDDRLQRRSRLPGQHDEPAQADEEGDGLVKGQRSTVSPDVLRNAHHQPRRKFVKSNQLWTQQ